MMRGLADLPPKKTGQAKSLVSFVMLLFQDNTRSLHRCGWTGES